MAPEPEPEPDKEQEAVRCLICGEGHAFTECHNCSNHDRRETMRTFQSQTILSVECEQCGDDGHTAEWYVYVLSSAL